MQFGDQSITFLTLFSEHTVDLARFPASYVFVPSTISGQHFFKVGKVLESATEH